MNKQAVLADLPLEKLKELVAEQGEPEFRARQLFDWIHLKNTIQPESMTNLPAGLRSQLTEQFCAEPLKLVDEVKSSDGSIKFAWLTYDGHPVEAVMMPGFGYGTAICVSSQSGCPMACKFCETGYMGLQSWLSSGLILMQLYEAERLTGLKADRMVFMGMGEPLLNLRAVKQVVNVLTADEGRAWSPRRITVSTVGLEAPMVKLAREFPRINLALSLHFTSERLRKDQMPDAGHDLHKLQQALYFYRRFNGGKVTLEYALMEGINDRDTDARRLAKFARMAGLDMNSPLVLEADEAPEPARMQSLPVHVNLIAYNPIPSANYKGSDDKTISNFARLLSDAGINVTVRRSRGADVGAACGQLGSKLVGNK